MNLRNKIRPLLAATIVIAWLVVELVYGEIQHPTLELRLMLITALIWMFGESVTEAISMIRGKKSNKQPTEVSRTLDDVAPNDDSN
mgnify:CR=1